MQKTKKAIVKRFKITATGKVLRRTPGQRHCLKNKTVKQKRAASHDQPVSPAVAKKVREGCPFTR